jgi:hypothetical protein
MRSLPARSLFVATVALTLGLAGCAAGGGSGGDGAPRGSTNRIIREELVGLQQLDAFQAIQRLRPNWLRTRSGTPPQIMVDGTRQAGGLDVLRSYRAVDIEEMRYVNSSDATTRFGTGFDGGAILLTTRR